MIRVCLLTPELAPAGGGIGTYTAALCDVLGAVAEVTVVTREEHREVVSVAHPDLDIAYVPAGDEQTWTAAAAEVIAEHYRGRGPDLVETSDFLGLAYGPLVARAAGHPALRDTRIVVRLHTTSEMGDVLDGVDISTPYKTGLHAMERAALIGADRVLWSYGDVLGTYERFYGSRALAPTVKLGQPLEGVDPSAPTRETDDERLHVVHVGRLERRKGVLDLLAALLRDASDRWRLDFLGADTDTGPDGRSMLEVLRSMAPGDERVRYLGTRSRQDVDAVLAAADVMVLPSLWECGAYSVLEAMRAGCPVLSTPVGGMTEIVEHEVTGFLTRGTGPDALALGLAPLIAEPARARAVRASGASQRRVGELTDPDPIRRGFARLAAAPFAARPVPGVTAPGRPPRRMRWEARTRPKQWIWPGFGSRR